jgi:uncharacterized protein YndB with AHSA1/START domain
MIWKWAAVIAAIPVGAGAIVLAIGTMLPRDHVARAAAIVAAPPDRVAAMIRDVEAQPRWRCDVRSIEVRERGAGHVLYVERSRHGAIAYDLREEEPGRRFRSTIADESLPFGGFWTIALAPEGTATRVEIVEQGRVKNPLFRFVSALVLGHDATAKAWLADLGAALARA